MKILLVEDHADSRRNLQRLIERRGHEVVAVRQRGRSGRRPGGENFSFLILDWMLPGKAGSIFAGICARSEHGDEMFILLVTGRADTEDLSRRWKRARMIT